MHWLARGCGRVAGQGSLRQWQGGVCSGGREGTLHRHVVKYAGNTADVSFAFAGRTYGTAV